MASIDIALAQFAASQDSEQNAATCAELIAEGAKRATLTVLPENAMFSDPKRVTEGYHETLDGPFLTTVRAAAREHGTHVLVGFTETADPHPYNTLAYITPDGEISGVYRKIHLYDAFGYRESDRVSPAAIGEPLVFEINGVRIGALTCYDVRFPEASRWLVDRDVHAIALPAAWAVGPAKELHWEVLVRARAIENTVYLAAVGQTLPHCTGHSILVDPMGAITASSGEQPGGIAVGTIDTNRVVSVREKNPSLANRRFTVIPKGQ